MPVADEIGASPLAGRFGPHGAAAPVAALLAASLIAWIVTFQRMRGMDAGPGTDLGTFGWYLGIWVTMTAAMMLPSEAVTVALFARMRGEAQTAAFVLGYLLAWALCGLGAYAVYRGIRAASPSFLEWDEQGPWVAGGALAVAGLYQLTPLKTACLRHCRSPLHFLLRKPSGALGALRLGTEHGAICVGCCGGLMLALFALGVMSLAWMGAVAVAILIEKVLPLGAAFAHVLAVALVALGIWVAVAPGSVPGLTQPGGMQMPMQAQTHTPADPRVDTTVQMQS
jgi:predicted metal-binding membrane protein